MATTSSAPLAIAELREFAGFTPCEQRYIKRSLDVGLGRQDAFKLWARDVDEIGSIRSQYVAYQDLKILRAAAPTDQSFEALDTYLGTLIRLVASIWRRTASRASRPSASSMSACSAPLPGPGCLPPSVPPPPCRKSARSAARSCSSRSARLLRRRRDGRPRNRSSSLSGWRRKRLKD